MAATPEGRAQGRQGPLGGSPGPVPLLPRLAQCPRQTAVPGCRRCSPGHCLRRSPGGRRCGWGCPAGCRHPGAGRCQRRPALRGLLSPGPLTRLGELPAARRRLRWALRRPRRRAGQRLVPLPGGRAALHRGPLLGSWVHLRQGGVALPRQQSAPAAGGVDGCRPGRPNRSPKLLARADQRTSSSSLVSSSASSLSTAEEDI